MHQEPNTYLHTVQVLNRNSRKRLLLLSYRPLWWRRRWDASVATFVRSGLTAVFIGAVFVDSAAVQWEEHRWRGWRRGRLWRFRSRLYRDGCVQWHIVFGVGRSGSASHGLEKSGSGKRKRGRTRESRGEKRKKKKVVKCN